MANVADGHASGHLHDGKQRVHAVERFRLHRHAQHGQRRLGRRHARQVSGAAGAGNDDLEPARARGGGVFEQQVGRAMGGDHPHFVRDAELLQHLGGGAHRLPVRLRAHDDADERFHPIGSFPERRLSTVKPKGRL